MTIHLAVDDNPAFAHIPNNRVLFVFAVPSVGMSTVHEAIALNAMGARVAGVSLITNLAAGIGDGPLSHEEVIETGQQASERFRTMLTGFCEGIKR